MSTMNDRDYHEVRARQELTRAEQSSDPSVARVHRELAALHRRRLVEIVHLGEVQFQQVPTMARRQPQHDF
jgi:hypothetical protein